MYSFAMPLHDDMRNQQLKSNLMAMSTDYSKTAEEMFSTISPLTPSMKSVIKRYPCKARNVCETHNPESAYIELPPDVSHGMTLFCSHPTCVKTGRVFRWCEVCALIVAKRNFVKRHSHGLLPSKRNRVSHEIDTPLDNGRQESLIKNLSSLEDLQTYKNQFVIDYLAIQNQDYRSMSSSCTTRSELATNRYKRYNEQSMQPFPASSSLQSQKGVDVDEDASSIEIIGDLKGWSEEFIDSVFD
jgi:hypothetical protein